MPSTRSEAVILSAVRTPVDHILETLGLKDAERVAMLGGTMCKLLNIPG